MRTCTSTESDQRRRRRESESAQIAIVIGGGSGSPGRADAVCTRLGCRAGTASDGQTSDPSLNESSDAAGSNCRVNHGNALKHVQVVRVGDFIVAQRAQRPSRCVESERGPRAKFGGRNARSWRPVKKDRRHAPQARWEHLAQAIAMRSDCDFCVPVRPAPGRRRSFPFASERRQAAAVEVLVPPAVEPRSYFRDAVRRIDERGSRRAAGCSLLVPKICASSQTRGRGRPARCPPFLRHVKDGKGCPSR